MTTEGHGQNGTNDRFKSGFTLIELLVVIVIVAILSGLLLTAIAAARRFADRTKAGVEIRSLELALNKYYTEYRRWPNLGQLGSPVADPNDPEAEPVPIIGDLAKMLQGDDIGPGENSRRMKFIEFQNSDTDGNPVNPWKKPDELPPAPYDYSGGIQYGYYYFKLDGDFDNAIDADTVPTQPPTNSMRRSVIVWTKDLYRDVIMGSWDE